MLFLFRRSGYIPVGEFFWKNKGGKGIDDEYVMTEESFGAAMGPTASTHLSILSELFGGVA